MSTDSKARLDEINALTAELVSANEAWQSGREAAEEIDGKRKKAILDFESAMSLEDFRAVLSGDLDQVNFFAETVADGNTRIWSLHLPSGLSTITDDLMVVQYGPAVVRLCSDSAHAEEDKLCLCVTGFTSAIAKIVARDIEFYESKDIRVLHTLQECEMPPALLSKLDRKEKMQMRLFNMPLDDSIQG